MRPPAAILFLLATLLPVAAQDAPLPQDRAAIDACLTQNKDTPERCIGAVFEPCVKRPPSQDDKAPPESTAGQGDCAQREILVWDEKSAASLKQLLAGSLGQTMAQPWNRPPQNKRAHAVPGTDIINDMEKTWALWRAKMCDTEAMQWEGGSLSRIVYGTCLYRETGRHALWLLQQVDDNTR